MSSSRPLTNTSNTTADDDDLTWLSFLRSAGGTAPDRPAVPERSTSIDRKRRHTGSEHSGPSRTYPYPTSAASSSANTAASSGTLRRPSAMSANISTAATGTAASPIDLTSPSRPTPPKHRSSVSSHHSHNIRARNIREASDSRRSSELRLPRWQPDHEATECPVCKNDFGFWNRRHHCRKCGRVVCSACSPHRITIPRQYIVQPPSPFSSEFGIDQTVEGELNKVLGGGEVVRVCNPCVPDPWTPENANVRGGAEEAGRPRPLIEGARNASETATRRDIPMPPPPPPQAGAGRHRSQSHQPATATLSRSIPHPQPHADSSIISRDRAYSRPDPVSPHQSRSISHRYAHSHSHGMHAPLPPIPSFPGRSGDSSRPSITTAPSAPPQPRRVIREEDECPVCGAEMPPGEQLREAHIQSCIASRFSSSTPSSSTVPSMPPPPPQPPARRTSHMPISDPAASASTTTPTASTESGSRPRATSYRPRGMALYTATEKDCLDPSGAGEAQECVICLEEFQPGDEMGRMECLCKFHRACIRGWWERKGVGSCPTHQLHD